MSAPMERRGSRARRKLLAIDTGPAEARCDNNDVSGSEPLQQSKYGQEEDKVEEEDPPVIDTTSVEVERKADGKSKKIRSKRTTNQTEAVVPSSCIPDLRARAWGGRDVAHTTIVVSILHTTIRGSNH